MPSYHGVTWRNVTSDYVWEGPDILAHHALGRRNAWPRVQYTFKRSFHRKLSTEDAILHSWSHCKLSLVKLSTEYMLFWSGFQRNFNRNFWASAGFDLKLFTAPRHVSIHQKMLFWSGFPKKVPWMASSSFSNISSLPPSPSSSCLQQRTLHVRYEQPADEGEQVTIWRLSMINYVW